MVIEQNREIIFQLYTHLCSHYQSRNYHAKVNSLTSYAKSARPTCLKAFKRFFGSVSEAFPDFKINIDNLIAKEDRVMARYTISGTQKGQFLGLAPTNEPMTISGLDIFRLDNGKIVEHWDAAHQISALPIAFSGTGVKGKKKKAMTYEVLTPGTKQLSLST